MQLAREYVEIAVAELQQPEGGAEGKYQQPESNPAVHRSRITWKNLSMRSRLFILLAAIVWTAACGSNTSSLTPDRAATVEREVKAYAGTVAQDITREGPGAWRRHFEDSPAFFMASGGLLVFPNSAAATAAIQDLIHTLPHVELTWGQDLRVDPLTPDLAVMAATYHEVQVNDKGITNNETGFFTGTAERKDGQWKFRNAHWSTLAPAVH